MATKAVRFIAGTRNSPQGSIRIQLHVKPGASKAREGVTAVNDNTIGLCVTAQPRDGEANNAVVTLLSSILHVPKSRLSLSHGLKSRDKTVVLSDIVGDGDEYANMVLRILSKASNT